MTLATDLYLRLSEEDTFINALPGALDQVTSAFGTVFARLIEESPSLAKFLPTDITSYDMSVEPIMVSIGGFHLSLEFVGLLNKPVIVGDESEVEVDNRLNAIVDLSVVREGTDVPFVATIGLGKVDGLWEEFVPSLDEIYTYETIDSLETWVEGFLRASLIEHSYIPGAFELDSEILVDDLAMIDGDVIN